MPSKPTLVFAFSLGAWCVLATAQRPDSLPALETRVERLQVGIERVESVRAIKRLQYAYGHYVELGLWNDFADLFADDAVTNYQSGVRGKNAIRRLFLEQVGRGKLGLSEGRIYPHILFQPVVTLAPPGRTAQGRWRILAMLGGLGGSATWYSGVYENEYVLDGGVWKISVLHSEPKVTAAYTDAGWKDSGVHVPFHYTAASVTTPIPDSGSSSTKASGTTPSLTSLADRVHQLARRAARLKDQAGVTNLQNTYGYAVDRKLWDQVADFFAVNGTLELGLQGVYAGKASIRHALDQFGHQGLRDGEVNDHAYLQTIVSVAADGRAANARGVELIMSSASGGELSEGVFENTFVKQDGNWKIQSVHFYPRMIVDAAAGWAKSAKPATGPSQEFPPDRPPTASYEIYPKFAVAPLHFDNPVTGKPPRYPAGVQTVEQSAIAPAALAGEPPIRNTKDLQAAVAKVERGLNAAEAYDAAENLIGAYGYYLDESQGEAASLFMQPVRPTTPESSIFVNQILQPVIDVAADGKSAKFRARRLDLGGVSGGAGYWGSGTLAGEIVSEQGRWRFQRARSAAVWSAPYPGGWARIR
jgi:hypothetical protein